MRGFLALLLLLAGVSLALPPKRIWVLETPPDSSVLSQISADPPRHRTCVKNRWGRAPLCIYGKEEKGNAAFQRLLSLAGTNCCEIEEDKILSPKQEQSQEIPSGNAVAGSFGDGDEQTVMITEESS